jgi:hypothetical protein
VAAGGDGWASPSTSSCRAGLRCGWGPALTAAALVLVFLARSGSLARALAQAHGMELVQHQTQPTIGHQANMHVVAGQLHATKPCELNNPSSRMRAVFVDPPVPKDGLFRRSRGSRRLSNSANFADRLCGGW